MKAWIYVEGRGDVLALKALWRKWLEDLRKCGHGITILPLIDKSRLLRKIGYLAAEKLVNNDDDVVVGLPDLYPNNDYKTTPEKHDNYSELQNVQRRKVVTALHETFGVPKAKQGPYLERFLPSAFKHDLEVLLLAAKAELRATLRTTEKLGGWRVPVEDQNQSNPPKYVVQNLFRTKLTPGRKYQETTHPAAVLRLVRDVGSLLFTDDGRENCPVFKSVLDWLGARFDVPAYTNSTELE